MKKRQSLPKHTTTWMQQGVACKQSVVWILSFQAVREGSVGCDWLRRGARRSSALLVKRKPEEEEAEQPSITALTDTVHLHPTGQHEGALLTERKFLV